MPTIKLEEASKFYKSDRKAGPRLEIGVADVDLTIRQGEFAFLIGSSGAGKSTLLQLMAGQLRPDHGKVRLNNRDLSKMMLWSRNRAALLFGQVWQEQGLIRQRTVEENLSLAIIIGGLRTDSAKRQSMVEKVLGLVGMSGVEKRYPAELSLGECRRVELARALINSPPILILDEITANLDDDTIWDMFHLLHEINKMGTTVVMATHASQYVNIMRRRVITLVDGRIFGDVKKGRYGDVV